MYDRGSPREVEAAVGLCDPGNRHIEPWTAESESSTRQMAALPEAFAIPKMKVADLKRKLEELELPTDGLKAVLV